MQSNEDRGLAGELPVRTLRERQIPKQVREFLAMKVADYDDDPTILCETLASSIEPGEIDRYDGKIRPADINKLFPGEQVLGVAERGHKEEAPTTSTCGFWSEVRGQVSADHGTETICQAGTANYQEQPHRMVVRNPASLLAGTDSGTDYDLVTVGGKELVSLREKQVPNKALPYSSEKKHEVDFVNAPSGIQCEAPGTGAWPPGAFSRLQRGHFIRIRKCFHQAIKNAEKAYLTLPGEAFDPKRSLRGRRSSFHAEVQLLRTGKYLWPTGSRCNPVHTGYTLSTNS